MPENINLAEQLTSTLKDLPEEIQNNLVKSWTEQAVGAKKVCDMIGHTG